MLRKGGARAAALMLMAAVIAVSGCTGPRPPSNGSGGGSSGGSFHMTPNDGLTLSFSAPGSPYNEDDSIVLELQAENTGEATANWVSGYPRTFGASFLVDTAACGTQSPTDGGLSSLSPVVASASQPGGQVTVVWQCGFSGSLGEGEHDTFPAGVEVQYGYETYVKAPLTLISKSEYDGGGASQVRVDNSAAPVHAAIKMSSPRPVPSGGTTLSVPIEVTNVGDGEVAGTVSIKDISISGFNDDDITCSSTDFELVQGSRTITCDITVSNPPSIETSYTLDMTLSYEYKETLESSVTINGLPG